MELHLEQEEASLLYRVIENRLTELRGEVHHTKESEPRAYLKHKEAILGRLLAKFPEHEAGAHRRGFQVES